MTAQLDLVTKELNDHWYVREREEFFFSARSSFLVGGVGFFLPSYSVRSFP